MLLSAWWGWDNIFPKFWSFLDAYFSPTAPASQDGKAGEEGVFPRLKHKGRVCALGGTRGWCTEHRKSAAPADGWASCFMTRKSRPCPPPPASPHPRLVLPQAALGTAAQMHSGFACQLPGLTSQIYLLTQPFERLMCSRKIESCPSKPPSDWAVTSDSCKQLH